MSQFDYSSTLRSQWINICNNRGFHRMDEVYDFADRLHVYATRVGQKLEGLDIYQEFIKDMNTMAVDEVLLNTIQSRKELDWSRLDIIFRRLPKQENEYYRIYTKAVMINRARIENVQDARRLLLGALQGGDEFRQDALLQEIQHVCRKYEGVAFAANVFSTWFKK